MEETTNKVVETAEEKVEESTKSFDWKKIGKYVGIGAGTLLAVAGIAALVKHVNAVETVKDIVDAVPADAAADVVEAAADAAVVA